MTISIRSTARFAKGCVFRDGMTEEKALAEAIKNTVPLMRGEEVVEYPADQATLTQRYTAEAVSLSASIVRPILRLPSAHDGPRALAASDNFREEWQWVLGDAIRRTRLGRRANHADAEGLQLDEGKRLFIFTSDNGAARARPPPWRGKKASNFEEGGARTVYDALARANSSGFDM